MKNLLLTTAIILFAVICGCGPTSKKGAWTENDKKDYYKSIEEVDLTSFGDKKQEWIDCYYKKLEANYESYAATNKDEAGCEKLALECNDEVLGEISEKGKWSAEDKDAYHKAMDSEDMSAFGKDKDKWIECYLSKLEANYASFADADKDADGCEKLAMECNDEIIK